MYECPNCGGDLRFDIPSQMLKCEHCDTTYDPYSVEKEQDAEERMVEVHPEEAGTGDYTGEGADSGAAPETEASKSAEPGKASDAEASKSTEPAEASGIEASGEAGNGKNGRVMQMTIFSCKSCGAEISSTNLSAAGFCSYCGQPAVFSSRISNERRPEKIIPFKSIRLPARTSL